jgi:hypothetical protein
MAFGAPIRLAPVLDQERAGSDSAEASLGWIGDAAARAGRPKALLGREPVRG